MALLGGSATLASLVAHCGYHVWASPPIPKIPLGRVMDQHLLSSSGQPSRGGGTFQWRPVLGGPGTRGLSCIGGKESKRCRIALIPACFCSLLSLLPYIRRPSIFSLKILDKSIVLCMEKYGTCQGVSTSFVGQLSRSQPRSWWRAWAKA